MLVRVYYSIEIWPPQALEAVTLEGEIIIEGVKNSHLANLAIVQGELEDIKRTRVYKTLEWVRKFFKKKRPQFSLNQPKKGAFRTCL